LQRDMLRVICGRLFEWTYWDGGADFDNNEKLTMFTDWGELNPPMQGVDVYADGSDDVTYRFNPFNEWADAGKILEAMRARGFEVIVGALKSNYCVEIRTWEQAPEGQGDPHTGRRRVTFILETGLTGPGTITSAVHRAITSYQWNRRGAA
jgi:hypothetical protein